MLLPLLLLLTAASAVPLAPAGTHHDPWWTRLGLFGTRHGSFAVDYGMPQNGDGWFWNINGWSLAESELSVVDQDPIQTFTVRPALFGAHIVSSPGLLGHLLPLNSFTVHDNASHDLTIPYPLSKENTGCPPLRVPDGHPRPSMNESWLALIIRGDCGFDEKVRQAQSLGARAAVIGGQAPPPGGVDELIAMSAPYSRDISIPAVYITHTSYIKLLNLIIASNTSTSGLRTVSVVLGPEETWAWWSPILSFAILLLLPSIMTLITLLVHRIRAARHAARQRAPGDVVRALPVRVWTGVVWVSEKDWLASHPHGVSHSSDPPTPEPELVEGAPKWFDNQAECAICLSSFARGDRVRVLPCSHIFHVEEVDGWLLNRRKVCPICKADVTHPVPRQPQTHTDPEHASGSNSTHPGTASSEGTERRWWQRVLRRVRERGQSGAATATERTPLLS
ncbi:hypothetical protein RhiJN_28026 [Ceratobasidium sp. AG-Ba]|nr:hypothetical protein RhiJN_28026 [Ceratobasidium sp. AG-Ba]